MPGLIKGPGLSLTSAFAYYNSVGFWSGSAGFRDPDAVDLLGMYFNTGRYWLNEKEYASATTVPGWTFSGGTTTNSANRYAENNAGQLVAFASGVPRITDRGLLIEEARTNLLTYSQQFDNGSWGKTSSSVSADTLVSPDGTTTGDLVTATSTTVNSGFVFQALATSSFGTYSFSIFVKQSTNSTGARIQPNTTIDSTATGAEFTLTYSTGVVSTRVYGGKISIVSGAARQLANGWWYFTGAFTTSGTSPPTSISMWAYPALVGDVAPASSGFWQADLQAGSSPTSPIVTTTAAATRAADNASVTGLGSILATPVTLVAWGDLPAADSVNRTLAAISDGTLNNRTDVRRSNTNTANTNTVTGGVAQTSVDIGSFTGASVLKLADRQRAGQVSLSANGSAVSSATITNPTGMSQINLGALPTNINIVNGYIQQVRILPDTSDEQLRLATV